MNKIALVFMAALLAACQTTPTLQSGPNAVMSYDGLAKVNNSRVDSAWVRSGVDFSNYNKLMLVGTGIKYRTVGEINRVYLSNLSGFPLDAEQRDYMQVAVREVFTRGIAESDRFDIVDEQGPDTLTLTGSLIDVVSFVPPQDDVVDEIYIYITRLGEATLVLEISDSISGRVLARATDKRIIESSHRDINADFITNRFELERELDRWVDVIRRGLDTLADLPLLPVEG